MNAHEIFQKIDRDFAEEIISFFRQESRDVYKTTVATLAAEKKLRPIFIRKKPAAAQVDWLIKTLKQKTSNSVGDHLLQVWLLKAQKDMLIKFVDHLGIEHDEEGAVDDLPESIDAEKLKSGVDLLLENHPPHLVTLYLEVFQIQRSGGWPEIAALLESDARLRLSGADAVEVTGES